MALNRFEIAGLTTKNGLVMTSKASIPTTASRLPKSRLAAAVVLLSLVGGFAPMHSAQAQVLGDTTVIGPNSGVNNVGAVSLNEVAGVGNQQANSALVTDIPGKMSINQNSVGNFVNVRNSGSTIISDGAFALSSGLMQVSQASGSGNVEANAAFVGVSETGSALTAISLSQLRGGFAPPNPNAEFQGTYSIAPTAFSGASGLVQVQQTAGTNNVTANSVAVNFAH
jgi:hypothetical protein